MEAQRIKGIEESGLEPKSRTSSLPVPIDYQKLQNEYVDGNEVSKDLLNKQVN